MNHQNQKDTTNPWHIGELIEHPYDHKAPAEEKKPEKFNFKNWESDHLIGEGFIPRRRSR
jgi:hypothetical protein